MGDDDEDACAEVKLRVKVIQAPSRNPLAEGTPCKQTNRRQTPSHLSNPLVAALLTCKAIVNWE